MPIAPPAAPDALRRGLVPCLAAVLSIKLAALCVDPALRFFLGDSGTYLHTAISGWIPPDRSFLYGWLIGYTAVAAQSATVLVVLQTIFGVLCALLLYAWLALGLRVRPAVAIVAAALLALEPAQLFYERMMMAEATGLLSFVLFFTALSAYASSGRWRWIVLYAVFGVLSVAFRISLLPVVLVLSVLAPIVRSLCANEQDRGRPVLAIARFALHFLVAASLTVFVHNQYKRWYGELADVREGYTANTGVFRLGLVAPLVRPEHFRNTGVPPEVLQELKVPLRDPRARESQIWMDGGLFDVLREHTDDPDRAARKISIRAARDDPFGLVRLGLSTTADYFERSVTWPRLQDDIGRRPIHPAMRDKLREVLRYDPAGIESANTPATRWFTAGAPWLTACLLLLAPLAIATLWLGRRAPRRELRVLLALTSLGLVTGHVLFSHIVSFRYLHPLPWFVLANIAVLAELLALPRQSRGETARKTQ